MGCWPRRAGASSAAGCCPPAWWSITCWRWRCLLMSPTWRCCGCWWRRCAAPGAATPTLGGCGGCRCSRRWCRRALGWVRSRCRCCLPRLLGRWRPRTRRGRGIGGGGAGGGWATLDVADTADNEAAFGRAKSGRGEGTGAFPQVRVVGLTECGTHATIKAAMGAYGTGETTLAARLLGEVGEGALAGVLLLADRLFVGFELWRTASATGAELLWRAKTGKTAPTLPVDQVLSDGSWLSRLYAASDRRKRDPITVRVIEYTICDPGRPQAKGVTYRLVTTILDPDQAPAAELAALYHQRWEVEGALDELKTHQRGAQVVLRSKHPEGVEQEVWAHLLVHYAIRKLMHQAALDEGLDPDRLSFVGSLRIVRRHLASHAAFSP